MRGIRITTGILLTAAVGAVLLTAGLYIDAVLDEQVRRDKRQALRAEALLISGLCDRTPGNPAALVERIALLTGERATLFASDGESLADALPPNAHPTARPSTRDLWRAVSTNAERPGLLHAGIRLDDGSLLLLTSSADLATAAHRSVRLFLAGAFIVLTVLVWLLAARGWASVDRALARMKAVADSVRQGDLSARVRQVRPGALHELAASMDAAIDETGRALGEARARGRYYAAILDQMTDAVVAVDDRGHVQFINHAFARLFEVDAEEAAGQPLETAALNYEISALVSRALQQATVQRDSLHLTHPDDYVLEGVSTPLTDGDGTVIGAVALLHDITQLREISRVRQDFVANASHELRTPAAGVKALAEALQAGAIRDPELGPRFLVQIVEAADRLTEILDDMLTLTRVEKGARLLEPRMTDVATALEDAANQVRPAAGQKGVAVETDCDAEDQVYADPASLQTLLLNLLDNAVKYTPEGGTVTARGRQVPGGFEFTIIDTGVGIPAEHQERIFERFYRVDRARDRATGSTGLGLSIVKHIAEAHGGRVKVTSREGEGSTFTAFFPSAPE